MTTEIEKKVEESKDGEPLTFKCKICEKSKPLDEMVVVTKFFPPVVFCRECEKKTR